ncbi:MAG: Ig domain-containing protein, partial [Lachnospiraceae bacterium]|nr:Ig domain-containing protein [Lachnospiraceae bacterium]
PGTYTITVTVDPTLNDNYEINATATATFTITDHIFTSEPTFIWTDDYKDCSAEFTCDYDDGEKEVIQSEIKSREEDGVTYVYAQITVDGVTYTSDEVSIYHDDETQTDDEGNEFNTRIVIKSGFDEIEESLVDIGFDSEEKILEEMLKVVVIREDEAAADENLETVSELYDVELQVSYDGGDTWEPATIDNFPKNGLEVVLPYPDGTDMKTNNFNIYHMFAYDMGGHKAGEVEAPVATKTSNGIKFKVMGLSPIYITWTKAVTGVKLNKESVTLDKENATAKLSGIVEPADAAVKDLIWTSSNEKVAIVDEYGNVTAVGGGSCIITVTSKDGGFTATCNVTVNMPEDEKKEDTVTPTETTPTEVAPAETTPAADKTSAQTQKDNKAPETDDRAPVKETIILMISSFLAGVYLTVKRRRSKLS